MDLMQTLQDLISQNVSPESPGPGGPDTPTLDSLSAMMADSRSLAGPAAIGGLLGTLLTSRAARSLGEGAPPGYGAQLWDALKNRIAESNGNIPLYTCGPSSPNARAARLVRAAVLAAKSDGIVDAAERSAILREVEKLGIGQNAERLILQALDGPLDPEGLAEEVKTPEEALELYTVSCAAVTPGKGGKHSYLDALAVALNIPDDVKKTVEDKTRESA